MRIWHSCIGALLATCIGVSQAATPQQAVVVEFEITPTSLVRRGTPLPLEGAMAEPFTLHYTIAADSPTQLSNTSWIAQADYRFTSDTVTPFFASDIVPDTLPMREWRVDSGGATFRREIVRDPAPQRNEFSMSISDGYDTMGVGDIRPSWQYYGRTVKLKDTGELTSLAQMADLRFKADAVGAWFTERVGQTYSQAYSEAYYLGGGIDTQLLGDVTVKAVTVVPEPGTLAMMAIGLIGMLLALSRREHAAKLVVGAAWLTAVGAASAQGYVIKDLGSVSAVAINDLGQVAGHTGGWSGFQAFYSGPDGDGMTLLPAPEQPWQSSELIGINNQGVMLGSFTPQGGGEQQAFIVRPDRTDIIVLSPPGAIEVLPKAINNRGQVLAGYVDQDMQLRSGIFDDSGVLQTTISADNEVFIPLTFNDLGEVAGLVSRVPLLFPTTVLTGPDGEGLTKLPSEYWHGAWIRAINNQGALAGNLDDNGFYAARGGEPVLLASLGGGTTVNAMNDLGQIVGSTEMPAGTGGPTLARAFVTGPDGQGLINLDQFAVGLDDVFTRAVAINNRGDILVSGLTGKSYLLSPVPEPSTMVMMCLGLALLGCRSVRKSVTAA